MSELVPKSQCSGCTACVAICPMNCIHMEKNAEGFLYPIVDINQCIHCNKCNSVCQINRKKSEKGILFAYAVINTKEQVRNSSSSGGAFELLAEKVLNNGGVVCGAAFEDGCRLVKHIIVESYEDINKLMSSKYVQSEIGNTFITIREYLEKKVQVLFTGTPCQVNGLKLFLNKDYENLFTIDVICHGCPSQSLWEKFINDLEQKNSFKIERINLRAKDPDWKNYGMLASGHDKQVFLPRNKNSFMRFFTSNYSLRESCYECPAKDVRMSDITLGDFWGVEKILPEMSDGKGTSLVIARTNKGIQNVEALSNNARVVEVNYDEAIAENPAESVSVSRPIERDVFYKDLEGMSFDMFCKKYVVQVGVLARIKMKIKKIIG